MSHSSSTRFNRGLLAFIQQSPTPFHACASLAALLEQAGFIALDEGASWQLDTPGRYYVLHNDSSLIAFKTGSLDPVKQGIRLAGAHTDSPCLKLKPNPEVRRQGYLQLGVEVYGGALLQPWFDRDLSLAGRVHFATDDSTINSVLIDFQRPVAYIPSLAIHLDRLVNEGRAINAQKELPPILLQEALGGTQSFDELLLEQVRRTEAGQQADRILSHELSLYDAQPPSLVGLKEQFIAAARLDNLLSCYLACQALIDSADEQPALLVCNDHEEVGSVSSAGAQGPFLKRVLQRWVGGVSRAQDALERSLHRSVMFSIDNAHGVHPNYVEKHDDQHRPLLNHGPVIKINASQRYASNSESVALFKSLCDAESVACQSFVMRSDMACGSTIGPLTAAELGVTTLDIGVATFAMHSIRELAGALDAAALAQVMRAYYNGS